MTVRERERELERVKIGKLSTALIDYCAKLCWIIYSLLAASSFCHDWWLRIVSTSTSTSAWDISKFSSALINQWNREPGISGATGDACQREWCQTELCPPFVESLQKPHCSRDTVHWIPLQSYPFQDTVTISSSKDASAVTRYAEIAMSVSSIFAGREWRGLCDIHNNYWYRFTHRIWTVRKPQQCSRPIELNDPRRATRAKEEYNIQV